MCTFHAYTTSLYKMYYIPLLCSIAVTVSSHKNKVLKYTRVFVQHTSETTVNVHRYHTHTAHNLAKQCSYDVIEVKING